MRVLILEDNAYLLKSLAILIREISKTIQIEGTTRVKEGFHYAMREQVDVFLIDIDLSLCVENKMTGLEFAEKIRQIDTYAMVPIIFITEFSTCELEAFRKIHCYDYWLKPLEPMRFKENMIQLLQKLTTHVSQQKWYYFKKDGIIFPMQIEYIKYIEVIERKIIVHTEGHSDIFSYIAIRKLLEILKTYGFLQCHRSIIVNRNYIERVDGVNRLIHLRGEEKEIEIGVKMKKDFLETLRNDCEIL